MQLLRHRSVERAPVVEGRKPALGEHQPQHLLAARPRVLRIRHRVEAARIGRDPCEQRRLGDRQLRGAMPEVGARRTLDAVGAVPEVDRVQVRGEDLVLRPALLELPRERGFLQLAADRPLAGDVGVLHELLRDRGAALHRALVRDVGPESAPHAAHVEAAVLVEPAVLRRDDRLLHEEADPVGRHEHAALRPAEHCEDRLPIVRVDVAVDLPALLRRRVERAQLAADRRHHPEHERREREHTQDRQEGEQAELADPATAARRAPLGAVLPSEHGRAGF